MIFNELNEDNFLLPQILKQTDSSLTATATAINTTLYDEQIRLINERITFLVEKNVHKYNYGDEFIIKFSFMFDKSITLSVWDCIEEYDNNFVKQCKSFLTLAFGGVKTYPSFNKYFGKNANELVRGDTYSYFVRINDFISNLALIKPTPTVRWTEQHFDKLVELHMDLLNLLCTLYSPFHYVEYIVQGEHYEGFKHLKLHPNDNPYSVAFGDLIATNALFKITDDV